MLIENLTGYMLCNTGTVLERGDQWWPVDTEVFVCLTLQRAREILKQSHLNTGNGNPVWTTIYRVKARNLPCTQIKNGLLYTNAPTNIFVDDVVCYDDSHRISSRALLQNAAKIRTDFFKLLNSEHRGKQK